MTKLKRFFLWLFCTIGLVLTIVGSVQLLNLALKQWIFTKADYNYCRQAVPVEVGKPVIVNEDSVKVCEDQKVANKQSEEANATAFLIVGLPIFFFFLRSARKED